MNQLRQLALAVAFALSSGNTIATEYSPRVGANVPMKLLWGDTHLHSAWSVDAGALGAKIGPEEAVRFARGEEVLSTSGQKVKLSRAMDFIVISDHSDGMGVIQELRTQNPRVLADPIGKRWSELLLAGGANGMKVALEMIDATARSAIPEFMKDRELTHTVWQRHTAIQEKYNEPGRFTTLIAYEWTSMPGGGDNLHRNVIYRDGKGRADQMVPYTTFDSEDPEDLWKWMQAYEDKTGGKVLAIPHNGNVSNGRMFALSTLAGNPMTREYAEKRARWEPLYEATQIKGDGETHPSLSPNDEFANFERWDSQNLNAKPKTAEMIKSEYARQALKDGLALESKLGANPFKFGMVGSTDSHTGLAAVEEDNYFGKHAMAEPSPARTTKVPVSPGVTGWKQSASGLAAVWARNNTREDIWDALKRKEVYGTTGSRMSVRLFAGFDFSADDVNRVDWDSIGYARGVPMGGQLRMPVASSVKSAVPVFMIQAARDPLGANLDRVQIVKGWLDAQGTLHEKVYDVAWSGGRKVDKRGKLPAVGSTVDIANATYRNSIGAPAFATVWRDPSFDARLKSFYYVRVLEIPTPRWTAYDAKRFGYTMPPEVPMVIQERAYTSPIWYSQL
jgi:Protein of unknown function (DUF3604)